MVNWVSGKYLFNRISLSSPKPYVYFKSAIMQTKAVFEEIFQNSCPYEFCNIQRKTSALEVLFNKIAALKTPKQVFSYEYCTIFRNSFFMENLW